MTALVPINSLREVRMGEDAAGGREAALRAATRRYLAGERIDMSEIAAELGVGRATLYRWVGNHDCLLVGVLVEQTEWLFRRTVAGEGLHGIERVLAVIDGFMRAVLASAPLKALTARDPLLFLRLATMPGPIEERATRLMLEVLEEECLARHLELALPAPVIAQGAVRVADAFLYRHLLGGGEADLESALGLVALLLR